MSIPVNYDKITRRFAIWLRNNAVTLLVLLAASDATVSILDYTGCLSAIWSLILGVSISIVTAGEVLIGFEVIAVANGEKPTAKFTPKTATGKTEPASTKNEED